MTLMNALLNKLNYKGQLRIAVINGDEKFLGILEKDFKEVQVDREIDQRFPYEFMILFIQQVTEIELFAPQALHNLISDGILWFAFPKKTSKKFSSDIDRDHGWEVLTDRGFDKVRQVVIDENWSALRFRNIRFIRSNQGQFLQ
jgi:hypothetical protein